MPPKKAVNHVLRTPRSSGEYKSATQGVSRPATWRMDYIHQQIAAGRFPNCTKLAQEIEVAAKTIQRDITFMQKQRGLPIEYDKVRHGFYYTEPVSDFPALRLSRGELVSLFVAKKALEPLRGSHLHGLVAEAFAKVADACPDEVSVSWDELDAAFSSSNSGVVLADAVLFGQLVDAVMGRYEITFDYKTLKGRNEELRRVQPYHVGRMNDGWYVIANDLARKAMRTFALPRMKSLEVTKTRFIRSKDFDISEHLSTGLGVWSYKGGDAMSYDVVVRLVGWAAQVVRERVWHRSQKIALEADGAVLFSATVSGLEEMTRWVLGWGSQAVVLEPNALVTRVREEVAAMARGGERG
jgi:predicted DNA-binding transcriptional regulator YafY